MKNELKEKYGLPTAVALVVGIVVGSGVFFKSDKVLTATGGNLPLGILAWAIGGVVMIACACTFSIMATKYRNVNGVVDYAEAVTNQRFAYYINWFTTMIYYPAMTSVLAWVSARYTGVIFGWDITGPQVMTLAGIFLISAFVLNALTPKLAGKFQVSATIIKLIPLILMAVVGTITGLINGLTIENFTTVVTEMEGGLGKGLFTALVATSFAYEGWIVATSINAELKNAKRNLPLALIFGSLVTVSIYILYYIGLAGGATNAELMQNGQEGAVIAFKKIFGNVAGTGLFVFVVISCLGTLNGLTLASSRGMYSMAIRGEGINPEKFKSVDKTTNVPTNSSIFGLLICMLWLAFFYGSNLAPNPWFGPVIFDSSELPIITVYAFYIPIFVMMMVKEKELNFFKRFVMPIIATICCLFIIIATFFAHSIQSILWYLLIFVIIMIISAFFDKNNKVITK